MIFFCSYNFPAAQTGLLIIIYVCPSLFHVVVLKQSFSSLLAGIRSWDVDLKCCDLDQQLQLFITRHSAHFSSEVRGQCTLFEPEDQ
uniref:Microtubule-associated protein 1B/S N-terminal domain-containing protein n=1 Tax=Stegastes partitus TaxID=144197 RepID=A0A3B5B259_9TELE